MDNTLLDSADFAYSLWFPNVWFAEAYNIWGIKLKEDWLCDWAFWVQSFNGVFCVILFIRGSKINHSANVIFFFFWGTNERVYKNINNHQGHNASIWLPYLVCWFDTTKHTDHLQSINLCKTYFHFSDSSKDQITTSWVEDSVDGLKELQIK